MASDESLPKIGFHIPQNEDGKTDEMGKLTHAIFEDIFYNIIHGTVLQTYREEKIARANSAAIIVSQKAAKLEANSKPNSTSEPIKVTTKSAIYDDHKIIIIGNPLQTLAAEETRCSKCSLPRLLSPASGDASESSNSKTKYCARHPFVDKPGHDIYGQSFPIEATGPVKGKKRRRIEELGAADCTDVSNAFDESPTASPPPSLSQNSPNTFPNVKCPSCRRVLAIKRFAAHLGKCIGGNRRPSGRAAQLKMNGNNLSSRQSSSNQQNTSTPPGSRKRTPVPSTKTGFSPQKRARVELDPFDENYDSEEDKPEKKRQRIPAKKKDAFIRKAFTGVTKKRKSGRQKINGKLVEGKLKLNLKLHQSHTPPSSSRATSDAEPESYGDLEEPDKFLKPAPETR